MPPPLQPLGQLQVADSCTLEKRIGLCQLSSRWYPRLPAGPVGRRPRQVSAGGSTISEGELGHEGDVVRGPGVIGEARRGARLDLRLLRQLQDRPRGQAVRGVEDVVQGALEAAGDIGEPAPTCSTPSAWW